MDLGADGFRFLNLITVSHTRLLREEQNKTTQKQIRDRRTSRGLELTCLRKTSSLFRLGNEPSESVLVGNFIALGGEDGKENNLYSGSQELLPECL